MKTFKAICAAAVIAFSLSVPVYADDPPPPPGDIHVPGSPVPCGELDPPAPGDDGIVEGDIVEGDIASSALADLLWALASIY
jgi:hypothetical protein